MGHHEQRLNRGTSRTAHDRLQRKCGARKRIILLRNSSCVLIRIEKGADTEDDEEHREPVGLEVRQRNGIACRRVERLQDGILKVSALDRIDTKEQLCSSKIADINWETHSQVECTKNNSASSNALSRWGM